MTTADRACGVLASRAARGKGAQLANPFPTREKVLVQLHELLGRGQRLVLVAQIEDQLLVGDFEAAQQLATVLVTETGPDGTSGRKSSAARAIEQLAGGPMMRHIVSHLATIDETQFERVKQLAHVRGMSLSQAVRYALKTGLDSEEAAAGPDVGRSVA